MPAATRSSVCAETNRDAHRFDLTVVRAGLLAFGAALLGNLLGWWDAYSLIGKLPWLCIFKRLSGWDCPGCGMTRSIAMLTKGEFLQSIHLHPFGIPLVLWLFGWAVLPEKTIEGIGKCWPLRKYVLPAGIITLILGWWIVTKVI